MLLSTNLIVPSMTSQWPAAVRKQCARVTITAAAMCEIVYRNPTNKFQRHLNGNTAIYKQENEMWNVVFNMVAILSRPQYVCHYSVVIMSAMASQITGVSVVYLTVSSGAEQRKHQSSKRPSVRGIVSIWWGHHVVRSFFSVSHPIFYTKTSSRAGHCVTNNTKRDTASRMMPFVDEILSLNNNA